MGVRALFLAGLALVPVLAQAGPYEDCILQNMKGVQATNAANAVMRACKEKTTPKKCRNIGYEVVNQPANFFDKFDVKGARKAGYQDPEIIAAMTELCLKECAEATYWSRTFGECKTD